MRTTLGGSTICIGRVTAGKTGSVPIFAFVLALYANDTNNSPPFYLLHQIRRQQQNLFLVILPFP